MAETATPRKAAPRRAGEETIVCEVEMGGGNGEEKKGSVRLNRTDPTAPIQSVYVDRTVSTDPARRYKLILVELAD